MNRNIMVPYAHRAGTVGCLGNTMAAVLSCFQTGINMEIDVRKCNNALAITHWEKAGDDPIKVYNLEDLRRFYGIGANGRIIYAPTDVHGGNIPRIPALAQVFSLLSNYPDIKIILDIKDSNIEEKVLNEVKKFGVESQIIYGAHNVAECIKVKEINRNIQTLLFGKESNFGKDLQEEAVDMIRIWQSWENMDELAKTAREAKKKVIIMTGAPNEARGGVVAIKELKTMRADGVILNDASLCLQL